MRIEGENGVEGGGTRSTMVRKAVGMQGRSKKGVGSDAESD
jgi:hypothetical protein